MTCLTLIRVREIREELDGRPRQIEERIWPQMKGGRTTKGARREGGLFSRVFFYGIKLFILFLYSASLLFLLLLFHDDGMLGCCWTSCDKMLWDVFFLKVRLDLLIRL